MRGLTTDRTAQVVIAGDAFMQNLRRGHYELGGEAEPRLRVPAAFDELIDTIWFLSGRPAARLRHPLGQCNSPFSRACGAGPEHRVAGPGPRSVSSPSASPHGRVAG